MATTLRDVARAVNLSKSLVSGVLSNDPKIWVSDENRRRIMNAALELNYKPNAAARALRMGSTKTVNFTFVRIDEDENLREATGYLIEGCAERLGSIGFTLAVSVYASKSTLIENLNRLALSRAYDAFVLWGHEAETEELGCLLESLNAPFVVKGYFESHPEWYQIDFDHEQMMHDAVDLAVRLGHRRIAFMGMNYPLAWIEHSLKGYRDAMRRAFGEEADDELISNTAHGVGEFDASMSRWLALPSDRRPTAVIAASDLRAWRAIEMALVRVGLRAGTAPGDVLIIGYTGHGESLNLNPLINGQGYTFEENTMLVLGEMIAEKLLTPLLLHQPMPQHTVRLTPGLK